MATNTYIKFTDATTTITFFDGAGGLTDYRIMSWAPAVPALMQGAQGRPMTHRLVLEQMELCIKGTTTDACIANILAFKELLDKSVRWWRGEQNVAALTIEYSPKGSTLSSTTQPMKAAITGPASTTDGFLTLPPNWELQAGATKQVEGIQLRFLHRPWLHAKSPAQSNASSATNHNEIASITLSPSVPQVSPAQLQISTFATSGAGNLAGFPKGYVLVAPSSSYFQLQEAEAMSGGIGGFSSAVVSTARGGNVLRYSPPGTAESFSLNNMTINLPSWCRHFAVFANLQSDGNVARTWSLRFRTHYYAATSSDSGWIYSPYYYYQYPTITGAPGPIEQKLLCIMSRPSDRYTIGQLLIGCDSISSGPQLDIDTLTLMALQDERTSIYEYAGLSASNLLGSSVNYRAIFDHQFLTKPDARAGIETTGGANFSPFPVSYYDPTIYVQGASAAVLWLANANGWRVHNSSGTLTTPTYTLITHPAYSIPS